MSYEDAVRDKFFGKTAYVVTSRPHESYKENLIGVYFDKDRANNQAAKYVERIVEINEEVFDDVKVLLPNKRLEWDEDLAADTIDKIDDFQDFFEKYIDNFKDKYHRTPKIISSDEHD